MMKYIIAVLFLGITAGYLCNAWGFQFLNPILSDYVFNICLLLLLFLMGVLFGMDRKAASQLSHVGIKILVFPFAIALGSIAGGLVGALLLRVDIYASMGVCAGCGWYTLTGPLAGQLFGIEWAAVGFAVNFLRELITIVLAAQASRIDKYAPVAMGGATAMDTTLPAILSSSGQDALLTAFISGFTLTMLAPLLISFIATLAH
ncbi:MAG: lysine exporter LysO family protein [Candidatus Bathyarchaeota archaeon]|nr:lysine exporter LysO family protein [Candidatus Bathyarchaeota archaeon]